MEVYLHLSGLVERRRSPTTAYAGCRLSTRCPLAEADCRRCGAERLTNRQSNRSTWMFDFLHIVRKKIVAIGSARQE